MYSLLCSPLSSPLPQQLPLRQDSEALAKWKRVSVPIYLNVYIFNINNPLEVERGFPANLTEIGPFVFFETREKDIESINDTTIFYHDLKTFFFDESRSKYSLDHEVTVVNVPLIVSFSSLEITLTVRNENS